MSRRDLSQNLTRPSVTPVTEAIDGKPPTILTCSKCNEMQKFGGWTLKEVNVFL